MPFTQLSRRYLLYLLTFKPAYSVLCRYLSSPKFSTVFHFITSLRHWKTVRILRPRSIYSLSFIFAVFSQSMATNWFCGHCGFGPMMIETTEFCVVCHRHRDSYATYEDLGPLLTASLNQPEPRYGAAHCGNLILIAYQQSSPELGARGLAVQKKASTPTRCYCCHGKKAKNIYINAVFSGLTAYTGGDGPGYLNAKMRRLSDDLENCRDYSKGP